MTDHREPMSLKDLRMKVYSEAQEEFAERIGVNVATLSSWERSAKIPRLKVRRSVAEKLGRRVDEIVWPEKTLPVAA